MGFEAAGVVDSVGPGITGFAPGDLVAVATGGLGAYAGVRLVPAAATVRVPDGIELATAAAVLFKGLTAWYLCHRLRAIGAGDLVLVHSAAGGVGSLLAAWCARRGARVLGTVGDAGKVAAARAAGCSDVLVGGEGLADFVQRAGGGRKADVVYDAIGRDTFAASIDALARFGLLVSYGAASGPVPPLDVSLLTAKGSLGLVRPSVFHHMAEPAVLREAATAVFGAVGDGTLAPSIGARLPLARAADAHSLVEGGSTTGAVILEI